MRINMIVEECEEGHHKRKIVEVPEGAWGLVVNESKEDWGERSYVHIPQDIGVRFVGHPNLDDGNSIMRWYPNVLLTKSSVFLQEHPDPERYGGTITQTRSFCWSSMPFAALETTSDSSFYPPKIILATRINASGLTGQLPDLPTPSWVKSYAWRHAPSKKASKWANLNELAKLCSSTPQEIMIAHAPYWANYMSGMYFLQAKSPEEVASLEKCEHEINHWNFKKRDLSNIWVTKSFAISVLYMHLLGWPRPRVTQ